MMWGTAPQRRPRWLDGNVESSARSYKAEVVALVRSYGKSIGGISRDLDLAVTRVVLA